MKTNLRGIIMISFVAVLFGAMQKVNAGDGLIIDFKKSTDKKVTVNFTAPTGSKIIKVAMKLKFGTVLPEKTEAPALPTASCTVTLKFSKEAIVVLQPVYKDKDGKISEPDEDKKEAGAVSVELAPVARKGDNFLEPEKICMNAQPVYKKATWKATVLPKGTMASITNNTPDKIKIDKKTGIKNNYDIKCTGLSTTKEYLFDLIHDLLDKAKVTGKGIVFEFVKTKEKYVPLVASMPKPPDGVRRKGIYDDYVISGSAPPYYYSPNYHKPWTYNKNSCTKKIVNYTVRAGQEPRFTNAEFSVWLEGKFKVLTKPQSAYKGKVESTVSTLLTGATYIDPSTAGATNTAGYSFNVKIDKALMPLTPIPQGNSTWNTPLSKKLKFTIPADGVITIESHACAQRAILSPTKIAGASGSHTPVKIEKYKILKK